MYACLYAKEFPAQALLRLRPEVHGKPCVVMNGEAPTEYVCSLNTKARLLQIAHGMTRVEVDTFPQAMVLPRSVETETATKTILLECAGAFSPRIEDRSEDTVFLCCMDITGTQSLFGQPEILAQNLLERVRAMGIMARVTISANLHTAICLAKGLSPNIKLRIVPSGNEAVALASLPLGVLDLTTMQAEMFALWGIDTLGRLAALPEKELVSRIGQRGKLLRQTALGMRPHLFQPVEPKFTLEERMELDSPVDLLESLLFGLNIMLEQLILRAKARVLALASVTISLTLNNAGIYARVVRPAMPSNDKATWLKLLQLDLEAHPPQGSILSVALSAEPGSTTRVQLGLFSPQLPETGRLDVTLARIRAIVGEDNIGSAILQNSHAPESFCIEPFRVPSGKSVVSASPYQRASMRQLRPPESASVSLQSLRPASFYFRARHFGVEHAYGPWRVSGDWWNQSLWGVEQWDLMARAQDGSVLFCCMMRDLMQDRWQIAALYD
jgi:protein ImuB